jgi:hypothetical protein
VRGYDRRENSADFSARILEKKIHKSNKKYTSKKSQN